MEFVFFAAHQGKVTVVLFVLEMEWLLSTGQDKNFTWHCSESGQQLGTYRTTAWVSGLQYPSLSLLCNFFLLLLCFFKNFFFFLLCLFADILTFAVLGNLIDKLKINRTRCQVSNDLCA